MAEFCFECYKKYFNENAKKEDLSIGKEWDLCEGCGEIKQTVARVRELWEPSIFEFLRRIFKIHR